MGAGCTIGTVVVYGGTLTIDCAVVTSLTIYGGTVTVRGTGAVAQLYVYGGTCIYNTTGTLGGNTKVGETGLLDFSQDPRTKTVTNPVLANNINPVNDPSKVVSSLAISYRGISPGSGWGTDCTLTRTAAT